MSEHESIDGVRYHAVDSAYFEKRGLRKFARVWSLWALGVGAVISGDFFGWNFGLGVGGFGGLFIATLIVVVMYLGLCFSLAEMSPALPHTGGAYSFGRSALGPWGGFLTGLGENMEYVLTPAVIVVGIGGYLSAIFGTPTELAPMWWLFCYIVFVGLNYWGCRAELQVHAGHHLHSTGDSDRLLHRGAQPFRLRGQCAKHSAGRGRQRVPALRLGRRGGCLAVRHLVLLGDRATSPGGGRGPRSQA